MHDEQLKRLLKQADVSVPAAAMTPGLAGRV